MSAEILSFETGQAAERNDGEPALVVDVEGYEGPLDLLLALARQQKVDLHKISILALADQYLVFVEAARKLRLELAADYLVMAAWLAYLKSRLLLPDTNTQEGPSAEDMASALANRLRRLEAIREASTRLMNRAQLGRDFFPRGQPEAIAEIKHEGPVSFEKEILPLLTKNTEGNSTPMKSNHDDQPGGSGLLLGAGAALLMVACCALLPLLLAGGLLASVGGFLGNPWVIGTGIAVAAVATR